GPTLELRQRIDRRAARLAPAADPDLEVQVRARRAAGAAHLGDLLAGRDRRARRDADRAAAQVHEDVVAPVDAADHEVDPRAGRLVGLARHGARDRRDDRRAEWRDHVLPLVAVRAAVGAEATAVAAERPRALDRE